MERAGVKAGNHSKQMVFAASMHHVIVRLEPPRFGIEDGQICGCSLHGGARPTDSLAILQEK